MPLMSVKLKNRFKAFPTLEVSLKNTRVNGDPRGCFGFISDPASDAIVYVNTEESVYGPLQGKILYRTAQHTRDYTGGMNQWTTADDVVNDVVALLRKNGGLPHLNS